MAENKWTKRNGYLSLAGIKYWRSLWDSDNIRYVAGDGVRNENDDAYICILEHTSSASSEPGIGSMWEMYWDLLVSGSGIQTITNEDGLLDIVDTDPENVIINVNLNELAKQLSELESFLSAIANSNYFINELTNNTTFQTEVNNFVTGGGGGSAGIKLAIDTNEVSNATTTPVDAFTIPIPADLLGAIS